MIYIRMTTLILILNTSVLFWLYSWCFEAEYFYLRNPMTALLMMHTFRYDRNDIDVAIWQFLGPKPTDNNEQQILAKY